MKHKYRNINMDTVLIWLKRNIRPKWWWEGVQIENLGKLWVGSISLLGAGVGRILSVMGIWDLPTCWPPQVNMPLERKEAKKEKESVCSQISSIGNSTKQRQPRCPIPLVQLSLPWGRSLGRDRQIDYTVNHKINRGVNSIDAHLLIVLREGRNPELSTSYMTPKKCNKPLEREHFFHDLEEKCLKNSNFFLSLVHQQSSESLKRVHTCI